MEKPKIVIERSSNPLKKYTAIIGNKRVNFGAIKPDGEPYSDFTVHKDPLRMQRYVKRHMGINEDWSRTGINTAGFWSRHLLWRFPDIRQAARAIEREFNVKIDLRI